MTKEPLRLKWGVARMIYEAPTLPIVIPIWHIGMDDILPNTEPYIPRFGKKVTCNYGKPIDLGAVVKRLKDQELADEEVRRIITEKIQDAMFTLREETERLHEKS